MFVKQKQISSLQDIMNEGLLFYTRKNSVYKGDNEYSELNQLSDMYVDIEKNMFYMQLEDDIYLGDILRNNNDNVYYIVGVDNYIKSINTIKKAKEANHHLDKVHISDILTGKAKQPLSFPIEILPDKHTEMVDLINYQIADNFKNKAYLKNSYLFIDLEQNHHNKHKKDDDFIYLIEHQITDDSPYWKEGDILELLNGRKYIFFLDELYRATLFLINNINIQDKIIYIDYDSRLYYKSTKNAKLITSIFTFLD